MIDGGLGDPVDGIKEQTPCDLHEVFRNMSVKVAVGFVLPAFGPEGEPATWHGNEIPAGYARVGVDSVVPSWETLELQFPGGDGGVTLREAKKNKDDKAKKKDIASMSKSSARSAAEKKSSSTSAPLKAKQTTKGKKRKEVPLLGDQPKQSIPALKVFNVPKVYQEQGGFDMEEAAKLAAACDVTVEELLLAADAALPTADIAPKFVYGSNLVSTEQLHKLPTHMRNLHQWYLDACKQNIRRDDPGDVEGESTQEEGSEGDVVCSYNTTVETFVQNKEHAKLLRWHKEDRKKDVMLRHPADGSPWRKIDREFKSLSDDARNLRFGLSTDGFNPFGEQSSIIAPGQ
ncbi:hypothetical protein QYE76_063689 [Lolium multiflorum]|uniref:DUF8039 domain-containing protein n=1 Tax=Lolium multiflorum TaxID=4521 RepID=A0AAD8S5E5_LOLMU|nr:hypothetical protein QYE76_063689 [Lolium multiflorum]